MKDLALALELMNVFKGYEGEISAEMCDLRAKVEDFLLVTDLGDRLGISIPHSYFPGSGLISLCSDKKLIEFREGSGRSIAYLDDGRQPVDGWYLVLSFPCGPYTFNPHYPVESFNAFFEELKTFGPDYCDTANSALYFNLDFNSLAAKEVLEPYDKIRKKAFDLARKESLEKRVAEAEKALNDLINEGGCNV